MVSRPPRRNAFHLNGGLGNVAPCSHISGIGMQPKPSFLSYPVNNEATMVSRPPRRNAFHLNGGLGNVAPCSHTSGMQPKPSFLPYPVNNERTSAPAKLSGSHFSKTRRQGMQPKPSFLFYSDKNEQTSAPEKLSGSHFNKTQRQVSFSTSWYVREYDPQHDESLWWTRDELTELKRASRLETTSQSNDKA